VAVLLSLTVPCKVIVVLPGDTVRVRFVAVTVVNARAVAECKNIAISRIRNERVATFLFIIFL